MVLNFKDNDKTVTWNALKQTLTPRHLDMETASNVKMVGEEVENFGFPISDFGFKIPDFGFLPDDKLRTATQRGYGSNPPHEDKL